MRVMFAAVVMVLALLEAVQGCDLKTTRGQERKGQRLYEKHCMVCHGERGKGDGYRSLNPPPADLTSPSVQQKLDADLLKTIHDGRPNTAMGGWKYVLSDEEAHELIAYIRSLSRIVPPQTEHQPGRRQQL